MEEDGKMGFFAVALNECKRTNCTSSVKYFRNSWNWKFSPGIKESDEPASRRAWTKTKVSENDHSAHEQNTERFYTQRC